MGVRMQLSHNKPMTKKQDTSFKQQLTELGKIVAWFDAQEELDVEEALAKIASASALIKASKQRLGEIENEFKVIQKDLEA